MNKLKKTGCYIFYAIVVQIFVFFSSVNLYAQTQQQHSVVFMRLSDGVVLKSENPDLLLSPASVSKLLVAASALDYWQPQHQFLSDFFYTGNFLNGTITGDLVAVGSGDPLLISEKLWLLVADLRALGLKSILGNIVIDNSLFDDEERDRSRRFGELKSTNAYDAPISAFSLNFNTFEIAVAPHDKLGQAALVSSYPYPLKGVQIFNQTSTTSNAGKLEVLRRANKVGGSDIVVNGSVAMNASLKKVYRSSSDPAEGSGAILRAFLEGGGIEVKGKVTAGKKPMNSKKLITLKGYPLAKAIEGLNVYSNNYIADMLVKTMGAESQGGRVGSGSLVNGLKVIEQFMKQKVGVKDAFVLKNGSGLDTANRLSAHQIAKVLLHASKSLEIFPEFLASLPASGLTGTLEKRFDDVPELKNGAVRAKTGTLTSPITVASLAGYVNHSKKGLFAFAIVSNGIQNKPQPTLAALRQQQERMIESFLR